ncbi:hypothetical protein [Chryseosolibacter indicus]|uniref:Lipoprotein n=1 Tax=Chryseosolibacter indicus TaxID=2782351 RepID=A0ABS5VVI0_9BACT|nr:hypothetical protein [Chryseosolibacter indicus]MBT1705438.1 hypothetical protein [Chryseosolibacter indicus]
MRATNILLIFGLLCSCSRPGQNDNLVDSGLKEEKPKSELPSGEKSKQANTTETTDNSKESIQVLLQFENLTLTTGFEEVWNDENYFAEVHKDTILIQLGLVSKISGQEYLLKPASSIGTIQIYQNYETSLTIMDEGPHVDLTDWTHYIGQWKELKIKDNRFKTLKYSNTDQEQFPEVTSEEILEATEKHLNVDSSRWTELAKQCTGPNKYPCGISISRINLKIILTDNKGITTEKYIIFEVPMGC